MVKIKFLTSTKEKVLGMDWCWRGHPKKSKYMASHNNIMANKK